MKKVAKFFNKCSLGGKLSILFLIFLMLMAVFGTIFARHSAFIPSGSAFTAPNSEHFLGTDDLGIDLWAQLCEGAKLSLTIGICSALLSGIAGSFIGIICGYYGGVLDKIVMRISDILIAIPSLPLMIVMGVFFGAAIRNIILVLAIFSWTGPARIARSKVISLKEEKFIKIAESYGGGIFYLTFKHFLPAVFPIVMVSFIRLINRGIVSEASLSFLGLGDPTAKSWGLILNHAISFKAIYFTDFWKWWLVGPFAAITLTVLSIAILARDTEKFLNVKL
ncbi:MAG: ABC transporter permease [Clostridiales bacterium]|nr:ABC transporter permease [Clostridiales bacterium]